MEGGHRTFSEDMSRPSTVCHPPWRIIGECRGPILYCTALNDDGSLVGGGSGSV